MFLQPGNDIVSYTCCPFSGEIRNTETRELYTNKRFAMAAPVQSIVYDETLEEYIKRKQQLEDITPLNIPVPKVERKHHFEFI